MFQKHNVYKTMIIIDDRVTFVFSDVGYDVTVVSNASPILYTQVQPFRRINMCGYINGKTRHGDYVMENK